MGPGAWQPVPASRYARKRPPRQVFGEPMEAVQHPTSIARPRHL